MSDLAERIELLGERAVERSGWAWATGLRRAAEHISSPAGLALADTANQALAADGAWGLVDLVLAGPALDGLSPTDVTRLLTVIDARALVTA